MHFLFSHSCPLKLGFWLDTGYNGAGMQKLGELEDIVFVLLCVVISVALAL